MEVLIDDTRVGAIAGIIRGLPDSAGELDFYSFRVDGKQVPAADMYPSVGHPQAIEFFFFACLQNFGFWRGDALGYAAPFHGTLGGKKAKGSDFLWKTCMRALRADADSFRPARLAAMEADDLRLLFADDGGETFPDMDARLRLTRAFGRWFVDRDLAPADIVTGAQAIAERGEESLAAFLAQVSVIPGYDSDRLAKKARLLAMALSCRPERFLRVTDPENLAPVVDYHLMRVALRMGLVTLDKDSQAANARRVWVGSGVERAIRAATYDAVQQVMGESGRSLATVDYAFWSARRYCPETEKPDCGKCAFRNACSQRTDLFQPVFRTTDY